MFRHLKRALAFLALSAALLVAFSTGPLRMLSGGAVAWTASTILEWCWQAPVAWSLTPTYDIGLAVPARDRWDSGILEIQTLPFVRNMPLFIAMMLVSPWTPRRRLLAILGGGLLGLTLLDGVVVAYRAWYTLAAGARPVGVAYDLLELPSLYHDTGGMFVAPVFIVAFLTLFVPTATAGLSWRSVGPNTRCRCGSGLKAKRCCCSQPSNQ